MNLFSHIQKKNVDYMNKTFISFRSTQKGKTPNISRVIQEYSILPVS